MINILEHLDFGNEAADDVDPEELASYFVEQATFSRFLDQRAKLLVATARKGVGKSALLQWISHKLSSNDPDALVIKCRGADLVRSKFNLSSQLKTPNDYIRDWMIRLCALVNRRLALTLNMALNDDQITLVETAELEGYKSRNLISCLLDRIQFLGDKGRLLKIPAKDELELLKRVNNRKVWIIIDDLDATYQSTDAESLELATFFSACRYLTQDLKDLFFRVTLRTDVWAIIRRYDESLDKVDQYVKEILWHEHDFLKLLSLRIKAGLEGLGIPIPEIPAHLPVDKAQERMLELVFAPKMVWADKEVETYRVIYTLSYERPRWAIQLCKISNHMAPVIEGETTRSPREIARFLYRLGFILARSDSPDGNYEHYRFDQMPDFLSGRTDDDFAVKWEIHPCYREALDIKKLDWSHRERFHRQRGPRLSE